jgi:hypothetical protein
MLLMRLLDQAGDCSAALLPIARFVKTRAVVPGMPLIKPTAIGQRRGPLRAQAARRAPKAGHRLGDRAADFPPSATWQFRSLLGDWLPKLTT